MRAVRDLLMFMLNALGMGWLRRPVDARWLGLALPFGLCHEYVCATVQARVRVRVRDQRHRDPGRRSEMRVAQHCQQEVGSKSIDF